MKGNHQCSIPSTRLPPCTSLHMYAHTHLSVSEKKQHNTIFNLPFRLPANIATTIFWYHSLRNTTRLEVTQFSPRKKKTIHSKTLCMLSEAYNKAAMMQRYTGKVGKAQLLKSFW